MPHQTPSDVAQQVNVLTARWAEAWDGGSTVMSGAGLWPLLAILADAADRQARAELAAAVGVDAADALAAAETVLGALRQSPASRAALGLWTAQRLAVREAWLARLPADTHAVLDEDPRMAQASVDSWADKQTEGLVRRLPVTVDEDTLMLLASALTVRTRWETEFADTPMFPASGPWSGRRLAGLSSAVDPARVAVADAPTGPVTLVTVQGKDDIDVVLALGAESARAGTVLAAAAGAVGPGAGLRAGAADLSRDAPGPGLRVADLAASRQSEPIANIRTVRFQLSAHHDLLTHAELFGLEAASSPDDDGWFPAVSGQPLRVQCAAQDATATFSAKGFVAAAVTAVGMVAGMAMPRHAHTVRHLTATFDRPFGFLAVHRPSGLILVAGWVADPDPYVDDAVRS